MRHTQRSEKAFSKSRLSTTFDLFFKRLKNKKLLLVLGGVVVVILLMASLLGAATSKPERTESYKDAPGAAGLNATIDYDCQSPCKPKYNFNVYIFKDDGQQIGVVRPDPKGKVNMALAEGKYMMLIGKQFGKDKVFPQEPLVLKNGKSLELKLQYKEG